MPPTIPNLQFSPMITAWNRLEGRPRTADFDRSLKAEVRDALWMVSRQWQLGEFIGDDAGSPMLAKVHLKTTALTKYQSNVGTARAISSELPLEVLVEHQPIPFSIGHQLASLDIRLLMGRQWLKLLQQATLSMAISTAVRQAYLDRYPIKRPNPGSLSDAHLCANPRTWQQFAAVAGRAMDGHGLYMYLKEDTTHHAFDGIDILIEAADQQTISDLAGRFVRWFEQLFYQPLEHENSSWKPSYLEHHFEVSAPKAGSEKVFSATEYYQGHLDWYNLDIDQNKSGLADTNGINPDVEQTTTLTFIPSGISFAGMPRARWWEFEQAKTNFGDIRPDTTDLNKLMLLDYGLLYANDWFIVPFTLPVGSIAEVAGLSVTDVFGERFWLEAAGRGADEDWQRWTMFNLSVKGNQDVPAETSLVLLPTTLKVQEAKPAEQIYLIRDEVANMVWGIEARIPLATGQSVSGKEAAQELRAKFQQFIIPTSPSPPLSNDASIRYQVVNSVPEHWIPFIPVHEPNSNRAVQLQRATLPRIFEGDSHPPKKVEPRTTLLREGLDQASPKSFFLHEEEVVRAGTMITKSFQRTRWYNGLVYTWVGIRKQYGRGEGSSGIAFDQILPIKK